MPARIRFSKRSICPVANTLDLIGEKWTLLVIRDMLLLGKRRFGELLRSEEGIPTNILTDRLRRLEDCGIVRKRLYRRLPTRYEYRLTTKGTDLFPILREMVRWANRHIATTAVPPPGWLEQVAKVAADEAAAGEAARARPPRSRSSLDV